MHFAKFLVASAVVAVTSAIVQFTNSDFKGISCNEPFNITWAGNTCQVTIILRSNGNSLDFATIASNQTGNSFQWTPSPSIPQGTYNFEIDSCTEVNYSMMFGITCSASSSSSSTSMASSTVASSTTTTTASTTASSGSSTSSVSTASRASTTASMASTASSFGNSTTKTSSSAGSPSKTSSSTSNGAFPLPTSGSVAQYASPFALVLLTFAAIAVLN